MVLKFHIFAYIVLKLRKQHCFEEWCSKVEVRASNVITLMVRTWKAFAPVNPSPLLLKTSTGHDVNISWVSHFLTYTVPGAGGGEGG